MDEEQGQVASTEEVAGEPAAAETPPAAGDQQKLAEAIDSWEKDNRFKSSWKGDPNRLYKNYRDLEKTYQPLAQTLSTHGYKDPTALNKALAEYKSLTDPSNERNQFLEYLKPLLADERYLKRFSTQIESMRKELDREKFGSNLTEEEIQALKKAETLEQKVKEMEQNQEVEKITNQMLKNIESIEGYAKENGLEFSRDEFIKYCHSKDVPPHLMMDVFQATAKPFIVEAEARKREEAALANKSKNQKGVIPSGSKGQSSGAGKLNLTQGLNEILGIQ